VEELRTRARVTGHELVEAKRTTVDDKIGTSHPCTRADLQALKRCRLCGSRARGMTLNLHLA